MLPMVNLQAKGLYTFANIINQIPPGAMQIALNVVIDKPDVVETRRGFDFYGDTLDDAAVKAFVYENALLFYLDNGDLVYDSDAAGTWVAYSGSFFPPASNFINSAQANGNFYFTTNNGVYKIAGLTGTPQQAGAPPALDLIATLGMSGTGTAVPDDSQVAYSVLWCYTDANNNLILGAPSEWAFVTNSSGSPQDVTLVSSIPEIVTTSFFIQVYRTPSTPTASVTPGNNFQLALQYTPDNTDISNGYVTLTDTTPDSLLGAYLYTADGQPTPFPNNPPPIALDIATYNGMTFYMNFTTGEQLNITMDSVGAPNGIQVGDTLDITDVDSMTTQTYTAAAANDFSVGEFEVVTSGTIAQNIDATARNLASAINRDPSNSLFYAYYQTGTNVLPGAIILTARNLQQGHFYVNSSRTTCWTPAIPTSGQTYISASTSLPGNFMVSKVSQPESVPLAYNIPVQTGGLSVVIYRGLALQDALYLFTNVGVFRVTGSDPTTLQVLLFDSSAILVGLQTPQILNNSIYYNSTQGVCNVSSGGNQIVSRNIERDVLTLATLSNFGSLAFGVSYESDRKYFLSSPDDDADTQCAISYVYNWITACYTLWDRPWAAAIVNPATDRLYIADESGNVFQERKSFTSADYADESYSVTIVSTDPDTGTIILADSDDVQTNDVIQQTVSGTLYSTQVTDNDTATETLTVDDAAGFAAGAATVYRSIATEVEFSPITCGFPQYLKKFSIWQFAFANADFSEITLNMSSDLSPGPEPVDLSPQSFPGFGAESGGFGTVPWGMSSVYQQLIPCYPSRNTALAHWVILNFSVQQAFTSLSLEGLMAAFEIISTRGR